jgi:hypothetical protein
MFATQPLLRIVCPATASECLLCTPQYENKPPQGWLVEVELASKVERYR